MISLNKKFIFIHIPKTAGTYIEDIIEDDSCICKKNQHSTTNLEPNAPLNHITFSDIINYHFVDNVSKYFSFTFIRNPWSKVISECFCPHIQPIFINCETIEDKINKVCGLADKGYGNHCRKQIDFINHPKYKIDFIGRFEYIQNDLQFILDKFNINHKIKSKDNLSKIYKQYYNPVTKQLVQETYKDDIEHFNYIF